MAELIYSEESYKIMGACFEVYKEMGCGFLEPVYQECLELEFQARDILFRPQSELCPAVQAQGSESEVQT